jgi:hypothetical protein
MESLKNCYNFIVNNDQSIGIFGSLGLTLISLCTGFILGVLFFGTLFVIASVAYFRS